MPAAGFEPAIPTCGRPQTPLFRLLTMCVLEEHSLVLYCTVQSRSYENSMFEIATVLFRLLFSNFRDWCRWSGTRWRGRRVGFPHSSAIVRITLSSVKFSVPFNPLTPNDLYMSRTAPLTSKRCILYIYSTNIGTEYFKNALYSPFFFLFKMQIVS